MSPVGGRPARELADAVRDLIDHMIAVEAPGADTDAATGAVRSATSALKAAGGTQRLPMTEAGSDDVANFFRFSPVSGGSNPIAPPMRMEVKDGEVHATCTFGGAYEGPPGYVHGAFVAAIFDELLGAANAASGNPAMTGLLEVRYHRPTPLHEELRIIGRHTERSGRKIFATGEIFAGDVLTAEAKGTFIEITANKAGEIFREQLERAHRDDETTVADDVPVAEVAGFDPQGGRKLGSAM